ncbi:hypothetical protein COCC4DRAFT_33372 [Bipolaris maydis ATCC 48331]|uniref:Uncharacterized protein n=2 Tax=Cochliobolus heterostrophus TaxID=5016 RepID=M2U0K7_COCH5|nr:uncharacterized protein COCC4DRAFT_33372 [Bipolaris maydis ATCC 48331]EMD92084.1 hypothetical protein COCHEDRAFT_1021040 [Bipolaris maydis C5]ENI02433.1 hypothetical protein COCC4DRAFT_33372 [Bipolaris maydis ATCC 48331]
MSRQSWPEVGLTQKPGQPPRHLRPGAMPTILCPKIQGTAGQSLTKSGSSTSFLGMQARRH